MLEKVCPCFLYALKLLYDRINIFCNFYFIQIFPAFAPKATSFGRKRRWVLPSWQISHGAKPPQIFKLKNIKIDKTSNLLYSLSIKGNKYV